MGILDNTSCVFDVEDDPADGFRIEKPRISATKMGSGIPPLGDFHAENPETPAGMGSPASAWRSPGTW